MDRKNVGRKNSGRKNVGRKNLGRKNAVTQFTTSLKCVSALKREIRYVLPV